MLVHTSRARAMNLALETGLVAAILPRLVPMKGFFQGTPVQPEGNLWDHTMLVLDLLPPDPSFTLAFAALLHDSGKPASKAMHHGRYAFAGHEQAAAIFAEQSCQSLKLSNADREKITWLVAHQQDLRDAANLRESKLKRLLAHPAIEELMALHRSDALASFGSSADTDFCRRYIELQPTGPLNPPPLINGHDLLTHGLQPNALFATLLDQIRDAQLDGSIQSKQEALEWVDRQLASHAIDASGPPRPDSSRKG